MVNGTRTEERSGRILIELLAENSCESLVLLGASDEIDECNQTFLDMFGFESKKEVIGQTLSVVQPSDENYSSFLREVHHAVRMKTAVTVEMEFSRRTGAIIPCEVKLVPVVDTEGANYYCALSIKDISHWERQKTELTHRATHDSLTDFPNRTLLYDRLALALVHAQRNRERLAVLFVDIDSFKDINYKYGYGVGDLLLKEAGTRLVRCLRKGDTVGRFGDDEYVVLLPGVLRKENVSLVTDKILKMFSAPYFLDGYEISISASIGISVFPEDGDNNEELVKNADIAMYHAKKAGKNRFQFFSSVRT